MVDQSNPPDGPAPIPADDPRRSATIVHADDGDIPHISLAGDTYTILLKGDDTAGRYTSSTRTYRPVVALRPTVTTSRRCSPFWTARSR
jgi:hypothetical protein